MNTDLFDHDGAHRLGESATHPIEPPWSALAALLLLAGSSQRRRPACRAQSGQSPVFFTPSKPAPAGL